VKFSAHFLSVLTTPLATAVAHPPKGEGSILSVDPARESFGQPSKFPPPMTVFTAPFPQDLLAAVRGEAFSQPQLQARTPSPALFSQKRPLIPNFSATSPVAPPSGAVGGFLHSLFFSAVVLVCLPPLRFSRQTKRIQLSYFFFFFRCSFFCCLSALFYHDYRAFCSLVTWRDLWPPLRPV